VIRFFVQPAPHVRFASIKRLGDDLALALRTSTLRISRGREGVILEFSNPEPHSLSLLPLLRNLPPLPVGTAVLGLQTDGVPLLAQLAAPEVAHILIAGTTGSGKSVLLRTATATLLLGNAPRTLVAVLIDPKGRTFPAQFHCPHLLRPVITDPTAATAVLQSLVQLMEQRDANHECLPRVVVVIDELSEVVLQGPGITAPLTRLAQRGREAGIHLLVATQRPSAAILSGLIRANFPLRLVGRVVSPEDARIAAGRGGTHAHLLTGRGDFLAVTGERVVRFQAALITAAELQAAIGTSVPLRLPLELPAVPQVTLETQPEEDDIVRLAQRLAPWWAEHGGTWGAKTGALRFLFGGAVPVGGSYWRLTEAAIALLEK